VAVEVVYLGFLRNKFGAKTIRFYISIISFDNAINSTSMH